MGESPSDRQAFQDDLRAQLKAKLKPRDFAPFEGEGIDMLIRMKCLSLDILRLMTNEDLMKADLPITLIRILEANKLIGWSLDDAGWRDQGDARGGRDSSNSALAGSSAHGQVQQQQLPPAAGPPSGAMLPVMEVFADGSKKFLGTMAIISPDGMAITARNVVVWADGYIHPRRLWVADGVVLRHVMSLQVSKVSLFQLTRSTDRIRDSTGGGGGGSIGGSIGGSCGSGGSSSSSGSGGSAAAPADKPWPFLEIVWEQRYDAGAHVTMCSYPAVAEGLQLTASGLLLASGRLHSSDQQFKGVADYSCVSGSPGGAVLYEGKYIGTHLGEISDAEDSSVSQPAGPPISGRLPDIGEDLVAYDGPVEPLAVAAAAAGEAVAEAGNGGQHAAQGLEAAGAHMSPLSLFTPKHVTSVMLQAVGIPPPQSGMTRVYSNLEKAAAMAGVGPLAKRILGRRRGW